MTDSGQPPKQGGNGGPAVPAWVIVTVLGVVLGLLVLVIVVSLKRDTLDPNGVIPILSTIVSGIVAGVLIRSRSGPPPST